MLLGRPPAASPVSVQPAKGKSWLRRLLGPLFLVVLVAIGGVVWWQQAFLRDWVTLRGYEPSSSIENLSTATTMTPYAQRLFYVNKPRVEEKENFNARCSSLAKQEAAVLGCFLGDRHGIYIYNITDERLAGIQQVTAAHEMLHQAYVRLDTKERRRIDGLLEAYSRTVTDKRLKDKIDLYRTSEPRDVVNEMHSVYGTEATSLPPALEEYYQRYFTNRQAVVAFHQHYRDAFEQRTKQIEAYDKQLLLLKSDIDRKRVDLDVREQQLHSDRAKLDQYLAQNKISQYNAAVPPYNASVAAYKTAVASINKVIMKYNQLVDDRNALSVEEQQLLDAQDSQTP